VVAAGLASCLPIDRAEGWVHGLQSANVPESAAVLVSPLFRQIGRIWVAVAASAVGRASPSFLPGLQAALSAGDSRIALVIDPQHCLGWAGGVPVSFRQTVRSRIGVRVYKTG
jgi:hypothetical protein